MQPLKRGPIPFYHQIEAILREKIAQNELRVGDRLPTEDKLREMFEVSRATVRRAIQDLENEGIVVRRAGRGTYVSGAATPMTELKMSCFLEDLIALGIPARVTVLGVDVVEPAAPVAEALKVTSDDKVFGFRRVTTIDDEPFSMTSTFLPVRIGEALHEEDLVSQNFLKALASRCGVSIGEADQTIEAVLADASQANQLGVNAGAALLLVSRIVYSRSGEPLEYSVVHYRGDRTRFKVAQRLRRAPSNDWVLAEKGVRRAVTRDPLLSAPPGAE